MYLASDSWREASACEPTTGGDSANGHTLHWSLVAAALTAQQRVSVPVTVLCPLEGVHRGQTTDAARLLAPASPEIFVECRGSVGLQPSVQGSAGQRLRGSPPAPRSFGSRRHFSVGPSPRLHLLRSQGP